MKYILRQMDAQRALSLYRKIEDLAMVEPRAVIHEEPAEMEYMIISFPDKKRSSLFGALLNVLAVPYSLESESFPSIFDVN